MDGGSCRDDPPHESNLKSIKKRKLQCVLHGGDGEMHRSPKQKLRELGRLDSLTESSADNAIAHEAPSDDDALAGDSCDNHDEKLSVGGAAMRDWASASSSSSSNNGSVCTFISCDGRNGNEAESASCRIALEEDRNMDCYLAEVYDDPGCADTDTSDEGMENPLLYAGIDPFMLSTGLLNSTNGGGGTRKATIDQEFEQYFSKLML